MFSNKDLRKLIIPIIIEQVLTSFMGTIDTMMVSNLGSAPVSGVSCVDSINKLVLFLFTAISTGGCIICSQFLGRSDRKGANEAARQVLFSSVVISAALMAVCLMFRNGLLRLIFGAVEPEVMEAAEAYFFITIFSYPVTAVFQFGKLIVQSPAFFYPNMLYQTQVVIYDPQKSQFQVSNLQILTV